MDDVLNGLMQEWFNDLKMKRSGEITINYDALSENPPHALLRMTLNQYLDSLDEFRLSGRYQQLKPNDEIMNWFNSYGHHCRHLALTAVPLTAAPISAAWVLRHFGQWIRGFHFVPSMRTTQIIPEYDRSKVDFMAWHGKIDILVDDNPEHIEAATRIGIQSIIINQPWNGWKMKLSESLASLTRAIYH